MAVFLCVHGRGLEPPRLTAYAPQAYMFTNYITRALTLIYQGLSIIANTERIFNLLRDK